jgi:serine/threonine protein kinase
VAAVGHWNTPANRYRKWAPAATTCGRNVGMVVDMNAVSELTRRRPRGVAVAPRVGLETCETATAAAIAPTATLPSGPVAKQAPTSTARLVAGRYRLRSLLGRGGMGRVWLAEDELVHRPVALKQPVASGAATSEDSDQVAGGRLLAEARAAARVSHEGVVKVFGVVYEDGCPWIVMEALSGQPLAERLAAEGPMSVHEVARIGLRLVDALEAIHRAGIVHRDVKPGNVYLCDGGRVVLTDFGIACFTHDTSGDTIDALVGSPAYISPEQLRGDRAAPASDLFSLGATLFAAVEGEPPFAKGDLFATLTAVVVGAPAPLRRGGALRPVIEGLLVKEPEWRLGAREARAALRKVQRRHAF